MKEYIEFYQLEIRHIYYNHSYVQFFKDSNFEIYHRGNDKPAFISSKGRKEWYVHGKFIKEEV